MPAVSLCICVRFMRRRRFDFGIVSRIFELAHGCFYFALDLLSGAFDLSSGVPGHVSEMALDASYYLIDLAFYPIVVHLFHLEGCEIL